MILNLSVNPTWMQSLAFVMMNYGQTPAQVVLAAMKSDKSLEVTPNSVTLPPLPDQSIQLSNHTIFLKNIIKTFPNKERFNNIYGRVDM